MKDVLINDEKYFSKETIERLKKKFKFTQAVHIEMLLWDFEIFSQLSEIYSNQLILKGGAATQLYLSSDKQRASRDIDFATTLSQEEIEDALDKIKKKFEAHRQKEEHFEWKPVPEPKDAGIEDLHCYDISVPTFFGSTKGKKGTTDLKIDTILYKELPFKKKVLESPIIFDLKLKPFFIITEGSLIGDKILTLSDTTVGILARKEDYEAYLKQVYDLTHLIDKFLHKSDTLKDMLFTLEKLTPIEIKYKHLHTTTKEVISDIIGSIEKRKYFDFDSSNAGKDFRDEITNFQGNYLNKPENVPSFIWALRLGKIHFIVSLIDLIINQKITIEIFDNIITRLKKAEDKLTKLKGGEIKNVQNMLIGYFSKDPKIAKQMKNSFPLRIIYGVIQIDNYEDILTKLGV